MPVYNREAFLHKSITSVLAQRFVDFELLCVNDGSTDSSAQIIQEFSSTHQSVKLITIEKQGRCIARNTGILRASGKWVCFLDSDDTYSANHLETLYQLIKSNPTQLAFATEQSIGGRRKKYLHRKLNKPTSYITLKENIRSNPISPNQLCYHFKETSILFSNEDIPISEDWLFMRQLTLKTSILKTNVVTTQITEHVERTMNKASLLEIIKWNMYTANYFVNLPEVEQKIKNEIASNTLLLCANFYLSGHQKANAMPYLKRSLTYADSLINPLLYKALIKLI
jgi:glycosyltransferase involved in cell wall biosynthesis